MPWRAEQLCLSEQYFRAGSYSGFSKIDWFRCNRLSLILDIFTLAAYGISFVTAHYSSTGLKYRCKR